MIKLYRTNINNPAIKNMSSRKKTVGTPWSELQNNSVDSVSTFLEEAGRVYWALDNARMHTTADVLGSRITAAQPLFLCMNELVRLLQMVEESAVASSLE